MTTPIRVFIGYDSREVAAYHVLAHSIMARTSAPVSITPLRLSHLGAIYQRAWHEKQSTEFSFTRFLVPHLCGYEGWAIFMDCDMLVREDIANLWAWRDDFFSIMCVQQKHEPLNTLKFLGMPQTNYAYKNWSSVMLMNCRRCKILSPHYVSTASGLDLHQFTWLGPDRNMRIGEIPAMWNHLVTGRETKESHGRETALLHYTEGGPWFSKKCDCWADEQWWDEHHATIKELTL